MSYKSRINLRISRIPEVDDPALYPIFQEIYNALHLINANMETFLSTVDVPEPDEPANESFPPGQRTFWAPVANNVDQGRIVRASGGRFIRGANGTNVVSGGEGSYTNIHFTGPFGVVVSEPEEGKARIAWPPFVQESESSASIGTYVITNNSGALSQLSGSTLPSGYFAVGQFVESNMILFMPSLSLPRG